MQNNDILKTLGIDYTSLKMDFISIYSFIFVTV